MTTARHLRPVQSAAQRSKCEVVVQAVMAGPIEYRVQALTPLAGPGCGSISIRLGRVVIVLEDRQAYEAFERAWGQVQALVDKALPHLPPAPYKPRSH